MKRNLLTLATGTLTIILAVLAVYFFSNTLQNSGLAAQIIGSRISLYNDCIKSFSTESPNAFNVTSAELNDDHKTDAIVQYKSGPKCGSAGCTYELCVSSKETDGYKHVSLGIAGHLVTVLGTVTNGMHDLEFNNDQNLILKWDKNSYSLNEN